MPFPPSIIIVMGVSGTGKSTLGAALAKELSTEFLDGDDLHPQSNIDKMAAGNPLNDEDRLPWLHHIRTTALEHTAKSKLKSVVIGCSSLRKSYREILRGNIDGDEQQATTVPTLFVFINGSRDVLIERMKQRRGHFMKASMLYSQLETLEKPVDEDGVVTVDLEDPTEKQVADAFRGLKHFANKTSKPEDKGFRIWNFASGIFTRLGTLFPWGIFSRLASYLPSIKAN